MLGQVKRRFEGRTARQIAEASVKTIGHAMRSFSPSNRRYKAIQAEFDEKWGTDTAKEVTLTSLEFPIEMARQCVQYQPSGPNALNEVRRIASVEPDQFTFIDIGSGKGRVVLCAAAVPFRRVIGVEYSAKLNAIANRNAMIFAERGGSKVTPEFWCGDAGSYRPPNGPLFVYFYNPFGPPIMGAFIDQLEAAMDVASRRIILACSNPQHAEQFDDRSRWTRTAAEDGLIIFELDCQS